MKSCETYNKQFLGDTLYAELTEYLSGENSFVDENGHSVLAFGERYKYTGGKAGNTSDNKPVPDTIAKIIEQLNSKPGVSVNSVLINRYTGVDSYLPQHSDDEASIDPESYIYTRCLLAPHAPLYSLTRIPKWRPNFQWRTIVCIV